MRRRSWLLLLLFVLGCGSESALTEVVVIIEADPQLKPQTNRLAFRVSRDPNVSDAEVWNQVVDWNGTYTIALSPARENGSRLFKVEASARMGVQELASARLISGYLDGRTRYVRLLIESGCQPQLACPPAQTCHAGGCVSAVVPAESLGELRELAPRSVDLAAPVVPGPGPGPSPSVDGGVDAALPAMPASPDGAIDAAPVAPSADGSRPLPDAGRLPVDAGGPSTPGAGNVELALTEKLAACGVFGPGIDSLPPPDSVVGICTYRCAVQLTCSVLQEWMCRDDDWVPPALTDCAVECARREGEWVCGDGTRESTDYVCDGDNDCLDGSDESARACAAYPRFICRDGERIDARFACNDVEDCYDGFDETEALCRQKYFVCRNGELVPPSFVCDEPPADCSDGSDEQGCRPLLCPSGSTATLGKLARLRPRLLKRAR